VHSEDKCRAGCSDLRSTLVLTAYLPSPEQFNESAGRVAPPSPIHREHYHAAGPPWLEEYRDR